MNEGERDMRRRAIIEGDRLTALNRHGLLDTPAEPAFDRVVALVRILCGVPIALISLLDKDRQWFKAKAGVEIDETPIDTSVCALAIQQPDFSRSRTSPLIRAPRP